MEDLDYYFPRATDKITIVDRAREIHLESYEDLAPSELKQIVSSGAPLRHLEKIASVASDQSQAAAELGDTQEKVSYRWVAGMALGRVISLDGSLRHVH